MEKDMLLSLEAAEDEMLLWRRPIMVLREVKGEFAGAQAEVLEGLGSSCSCVSL